MEASEWQWLPEDRQAVRSRAEPYEYVSTEVIA
jgi:hypothetical protein